MIKKRSFIQRLVRIPGMWKMQLNLLKGVPLKDKVSFMLSTALIVLR